MTVHDKLLFLKLGGSLITDKFTPSTPKRETIAELVGELALVLREQPDLRLILGHGSGSFGHVAAKKYGTRQQVSSHEEWLGFVEVWFQASALNRIVMEALHRAEVPAVAFPASASAAVVDGVVRQWDLEPMQTALAQGIIPVVYGDVAFDRQRGGTILSTEDIFVHLAKELHPERILLAGIEAGVWADYPDNTRLIPEITPHIWAQTLQSVKGSAATDVTGGMEGKVGEMMALIEDIPGLEVLIFSASQPGTLRRAIAGEPLGTYLRGGEN